MTTAAGDGATGDGAGDGAAAAAARPAPGLATTPSDSPAAARPASSLAVFADASGCGQMAFDVVTEEATIAISACK